MGLPPLPFLILQAVGNELILLCPLNLNSLLIRNRLRVKMGSQFIALYFPHNSYFMKLLFLHHEPNFRLLQTFPTTALLTSRILGIFIHPVPQRRPSVYLSDCLSIYLSIYISSINRNLLFYVL